MSGAAHSWAASAAVLAGTLPRPPQVLLEVPAGSLVFFSPHTVHGSGPNRSNQARRALIVTYQPAGFPTLKTRRVRNAG
jgi:ectoine hydroxylase-related dioxygenase (phytanoyl-CoA dioxygenase family)